MNTLEQLTYLENIIDEVESYLIADDPDAAYRVIEAYRKVQERQSNALAEAYFPDLKDSLDKLTVIDKCLDN